LPFFEKMTFTEIFKKYYLSYCPSETYFLGKAFDCRTELILDELRSSPSKYQMVRLELPAYPDGFKIIRDYIFSEKLILYGDYHLEAVIEPLANKTPISLEEYQNQFYWGGKFYNRRSFIILFEVPTETLIDFVIAQSTWTPPEKGAIIRFEISETNHPSSFGYFPFDSSAKLIDFLIDEFEIEDVLVLSDLRRCALLRLCVENFPLSKSPGDDSVSYALVGEGKTRRYIEGNEVNQKFFEPVYDLWEHFGEKEEDLEN